MILFKVVDKLEQRILHLKKFWKVMLNVLGDWHMRRRIKMSWNVAIINLTFILFVYCMLVILGVF